MRKISTGEQARMVATAVTSFNDLCDIYHWTSSIERLSGQVLDSGYDSSPSLATECGFSAGPQQRNERGSIITIDADAVLRVAFGTSIKVKDKVIARSTSYIVDGITPGRDVTIANLQEIKI
jgi:hypothetical protein